MKRTSSRQTKSRPDQRIQPTTASTPQPQIQPGMDIVDLQRVIGHQAVRAILEREGVQRMPRVGAPHLPLLKTPEAALAREGARPSPLTRVQREVSDPIPETQNQFYAHGGFMGAAPELMADPKWSKILEVLMPDVWEDVQDTSDHDEWIAMMENNPVMAAYGAYQTKLMDDRNEGDRSDRIEKMKAMEWDAFLPPDKVSAYKSAQDPVERTKLAGEIVDGLIIAHGTGWQSIKENKTKYRQYENVRETKKSDFGGTLPAAWMDLFGRALQLAGDPKWEEKLAEYGDPTQHPRHTDEDDQSLYMTFQNKLSFQEVIGLYKQMFNKETFSVLLDVKSRDATPEVLKAVVEELNRRGVHVYGVGTFEFGEIAGLDQMSQTVEGKTHAGPTEVKFFHLAGDLQNACLGGTVQTGDTVMFNAGSLISYDRWSRGANKKASYELKTEVINQLRTYKQHYGFRLGVYVQEYDIDDRAATMLMEATNNNADVFDLGFSWGGLSGKAAAGIEPSLWDATVGESKQHFVGDQWDTSKPQPSQEEPVGEGFNSTISIRKVLRSRNFEVSNDRVTVTCNASWNPELPFARTYSISLHEDKSLWFDSDEGKVSFEVGKSQSFSWSGLDDGTYYLLIKVDKEPESESYKLEGDIQVSV